MLVVEVATEDVPAPLSVEFDSDGDLDEVRGGGAGGKGRSELG